MEVLVIIVSATLSIFLVVGIIVLVKVIQILKDIKNILRKAEQIADKAEAVGEFFQKTAGPAALAKLIANILQSFRDKRGKKRKDDEWKTAQKN